MKRKAYYHLPGLFEFYELYRTFLPLFQEHRTWFYDWCEIGSLYGAPGDCLWGGGRVGFGEERSEQVAARAERTGGDWERATFVTLCRSFGFGLNGAQLRKIVNYLMREDAFDENVYTEWFQFSDGFFCEYDRSTGEILRLAIDGKDVQDEEVYHAAMQSYFFCSIEHFLGISVEEVEKNGEPTELASSAQNVMIEYFDTHDFIKLDSAPRYLIHDPQ